MRVTYTWHDNLLLYTMELTYQTFMFTRVLARGTNVTLELACRDAAQALNLFIRERESNDDR